MNPPPRRLLLLAPVSARAFSGRVSSCYDGDTRRVETGQGNVKVRLAGIDALEIDQPYGVEAHRVLCSKICGRIVDVESRRTTEDPIVGLIRVRGIDTSGAMVRAGAAWDYARYGTDPMNPAAWLRPGQGIEGYEWISTGSAVGLAARVLMIVPTTAPLQISS